MARGIIKGGKVIGTTAVLEADVRIVDGVIAEIGNDLSTEGYPVYDALDAYVLPGFIDIHNHGAVGFDASLGVYQDDGGFSAHLEDMQEGLLQLLKYQARHGVTQTLLTTLAAPLPVLKNSLRHLCQSLKTIGNLGSQIAGFNIEGSFLKLPAYAGAQNPAHFCPADQGILEELIRVTEDQITMVNIPPEHGRKGIDLIDYAQENNITVAGGHTGATFNEFCKSIEHGLSVAVHFFNGPSYSTSKPFQGGGAVEAMLFHDEVRLELILDGYHVNPIYVRDAIARKGVDRVMGITDSMFVNGLQNVETFSIAGLQGRVSANGEYLRPIDGEENGLFGSVLTMDKAFENLVNWLTTSTSGFWNANHPALTLEEALISAVKICCTNPGEIVASRQGYIPTGCMREGYQADLIIANIGSSPDQTISISCRDTFIGGLAFSALV